jgi:sirohydrochlorin ferrochelatase
VRKAIHFVNLRTAGRSSGNLTMNSVPKPAPGSETSGREDFAVGDKDAVVIVDHGSRRQESNLMLSNKPDFLQGISFAIMVLLLCLDLCINKCR